MILVLLFCVISGGLAKPALAQEQPRIIVFVIPEEDLPELLALADVVEPGARPEAEEAHSLFVPTAFYIGTIGAEWLTSSVACSVGCTTRIRTLPTVESASIAATVGTGINVLALWVTHKWLSPRWPRIADSLLYGLALLHGTGAGEHATQSRQTLKGTSAP